MSAESASSSQDGHDDSGHPIRMLAAFLAVYLIWGSSYLATRIGVRELPPFLFGGARFVCAGLLMLGYARWQGLRQLPTRGEWRDVGITAFFGFLIANGAGVWSLQYMPSNQSAMLNTTVPCWMVLLGAFGRRAHRPGALALAGLLLGTAGAVLLIDPWRGGGPANIMPQLVLIVGCLGWAINSMYQRTMGSRLPVASLIGWQMLAGGVMLSLLGLLCGEASHWRWQWRSLWPLAYLVVAASCVAHTSFAWLAPRTTPTLLGTYAYVNPLVATLLGWLVLGEVLGNGQWLGMLLVFAGVLLIDRARRSGR